MRQERTQDTNDLMGAVATTEPRDDLNRALEAAIDPWLQHMRWRADFSEWRERRLWQEKKQTATLNHLRSFLRSRDGALGGGTTETDVLRGRRILDLGSGMGGLTTALALAGAEIHALDFNVEYCRITRLRGRRYDLAIPAINAAGEALPFPADHFDVIVCMDVLEHVQQPAKVLAEINRCLKPGGVCQLTAINRFAFKDPHYHARFVNWLPRRFASPYLRMAGVMKDNSRFSDRQSLEEMHYYRYSELKKLFAREGFRQVVDAGEIKLKQRLTGLKGTLQRAGVLGLGYKTYRSFVKSTYLVMAVKG
jgi:2-polyprenyl-3-methyl-5-hydroxy-6-metoxy-1,4-benzoquinol methylase